MEKIFEEGICLISFSDNSDHQEILYGLFDSLTSKARVYTVGIVDPKIQHPPSGKENFYVDCPKRPGITGKTFRVDTLQKVVKIIKSINVRYVYFESMHVWNILIMMSLPKSIICVEAVHDIFPHNNSFLRKECQRIACHLASGVVIHSKMGISDVCKVYGLTQDRIQYMPFCKPFPEERTISTQRLFLNFGRIRKYKGLDALIEIATNTPEISYLVAGSPDEECRPQVERLKQLPNISVLDREVDVGEIESLFTKSSWAILPYESASQSGVIMEAYRFSRPVIAFDVGAISEQIRDGVTGYLVPKGNVAAFMDAVRKAASLTEDELRKFSHNAYLFGKQRYGAEQAADSFLQIIRNVKNKHNREKVRQVTV